MNKTIPLTAAALAMAILPAHAGKPSRRAPETPSVLDGITQPSSMASVESPDIPGPSEAALFPAVSADAAIWEVRPPSAFGTVESTDIQDPSIALVEALSAAGVAIDSSVALVEALSTAGAAIDPSVALFGSVGLPDIPRVHPRPSAEYGTVLRLLDERISAAEAAGLDASADRETFDRLYTGWLLWNSAE